KARDECAKQKGQAQGGADPGLIFAERADDYQHPPHVPLLPVLARRLRMRAVALDAGALHDARLSVAHDALAVDLGEFMDCLLPLALAQALKSHALEIIARTSVGPPRIRVVTILAHLYAGPTLVGQLLANVVQERCWDAERYCVGRGRDCLVDY